MRDPSYYGPLTQFMFRISTAVRLKTTPLPQTTAKAHLNQSQGPVSVWCFRDSMKKRIRTFANTAVAQAALQLEHQTVFSLSNGTLLVDFYPASRLMPCIPSPFTAEDLYQVYHKRQETSTGNLHFYSDGCRTSLTVSAFLLDMTEFAASAGRRANIDTVQDEFTSDLVHLAEVCAVAKPFDFDIKILRSELDALLATPESHALQLAMPPSTTAAGIQCHLVGFAYWFRFDSLMITNHLSVIVKMEFMGWIKRCYIFSVSWIRSRKLRIPHLYSRDSQWSTKAVDWFRRSISLVLVSIRG
jgi:hypothetical protein